MATKEKTEKKKKSGGSTGSKKAPSVSLAVKYRPRTLDDLVGQDAVSTQVRGMIKTGRFPPTLGLFGESGAGKTTTARMIARYINCLKPSKEGTPCGECSSCEYSEHHPDVHEINMANERGIDDARNLINSARSMPVIGNKRIFILDEMHACTPQALQTFLKALEEPPTHTVWILATTDPQKLPSTILGRVHKFAIKPIEPEVIAKRLRVISKREGVDLREIEGGKEIAETIANLSNGRMRDAISALEGVLFAIASGDKIAPKDLIANFANNTDADLDRMAAQFTYAMITGNAKNVIQTIIDSKNVRGLLGKTRWLLQALINQSVERPYFRMYSWQNFAALMNKEKAGNKTNVRLSTLLALQDLLCTIEIQLNSVSIDETVLFTSRVGQFLTQQKAAA